jgi:4'-phosphopantetheinyl transferase
MAMWKWNDGIHVWFASTADSTDAALWEAFRPSLDDAEHARYLLFRNNEARHQFLLAHCLLRVALAEATGGRVSDWSIAVQPNGKPALRDSSIQFNISHAAGLVACALSKDAPVGIDIEDRARAADLKSLQNRIYSDSEQAQIRQARDVDDEFVWVWTEKESLVKARGTGLETSPCEIRPDPHSTMRFGFGHHRGAATLLGAQHPPHLAGHYWPSTGTATTALETDVTIARLTWFTPRA